MPNFYYVVGVAVGNPPLWMSLKKKTVNVFELLSSVSERLTGSHASLRFNVAYTHVDNLQLHGLVPASDVDFTNENAYKPGALPVALSADDEVPGNSTKSNPLLVSLVEYPQEVNVRRLSTATQGSAGSSLSGFSHTSPLDQPGLQTAAGKRKVVIPEKRQHTSVDQQVIPEKRQHTSEDQQTPLNLRGYNMSLQGAESLKANLSDLNKFTEYVRLFTVGVIKGHPNRYKVAKSDIGDTASSSSSAAKQGTLAVQHQIQSSELSNAVVSDAENVYTYLHGSHGDWDVGLDVTIVAGSAVAAGKVVDRGGRWTKEKGLIRGTDFLQIQLQGGVTFYPPDTDDGNDTAMGISIRFGGNVGHGFDAFDLRLGTITRTVTKTKKKSENEDIDVYCTFAAAPAGLKGYSGGGVWTQNGELLGMITGNQQKKSRHEGSTLVFASIGEMTYTSDLGRDVDFAE